MKGVALRGDTLVHGRIFCDDAPDDLIIGRLELNPNSKSEFILFPNDDIEIVEVEEEEEEEEEDTNSRRIVCSVSSINTLSDNCLTYQISNESTD